MGDTAHWNLDQVDQRQFGPPGVKGSSGALAAQHRGDLEVDKLRCGQGRAPKPCSRPVSSITVIGKRDNQRACVNDEHGPPAARPQQP